MLKDNFEKLGEPVDEAVPSLFLSRPWLPMLLCILSAGSGMVFPGDWFHTIEAAHKFKKN